MINREKKLSELGKTNKTSCDYKLYIRFIAIFIPIKFIENKQFLSIKK